MTEPGQTPLERSTFPFRGSVIWLTPEQGGRAGGPPPPLAQWPYYAATAYVPPATAKTGLASFVLRGYRSRLWRSRAEGRWLVPGSEGDHAVREGSLVVITEGAREVAFFFVDEVT